MTKFEVDTTEWERAADALLANTKKSSAQFLKQQGRLLIEDLVRMTPPFKGAKGNSSQAFNIQKRAGESTVKRDLRRTFIAAHDIPFFSATTDETVQRWGKYLRQYAAEGRLSAAHKILDAAGFGGHPVLTTVRPYVHRRARTRRGRVVKGFRTNIVLDRKSVRAYRDEIVRHVGRAKAGWAAAASALGFKLPNWITRHSTPGRYQFTDNTAETSLTVGNLVAWAGDFAELQLIQVALDGRAVAMTKNLERILEAELAKANKT